MRDLRKRWRDVLVDYYPGSGIRQNLGRNAALGKKTECGMSMTEVRDAGFSCKRSGIAGSGTSFPDPVLWREIIGPTKCSVLSSKA